MLTYETIAICTYVIYQPLNNYHLAFLETDTWLQVEQCIPRNS